MVKIQKTHNYAGNSAGDVYQAILKAVPLAGLEIWKRRDIAWLVMVRSGSGSEAIDGNVSARPGTQVTVSLNSAGLKEADLLSLSEIVFSEIGKIVR
jgi:hypothetical protein